MASTLTLDFPASRPMRNTLLLLKAPSLWHLTMAALANGYTPKPQHSPAPLWGGQLELFLAAAMSGSGGDERGPSSALGSTWHLPSPSRSTESSPGAQVTSPSGAHLYARLPAVPQPGPFLLGRHTWVNGFDFSVLSLTLHFLPDPGIHHLELSAVAWTALLRTSE